MQITVAASTALFLDSCPYLKSAAQGVPGKARVRHKLAGHGIVPGSAF